VDQAVFTETLLPNLFANGLYLHYLSTYSVWVKECDYQVMLLKIAPEMAEFHSLDPRWPRLSRIAAAVRRRLLPRRRLTRES
jgi:hypothetical protein